MDAPPVAPAQQQIVVNQKKRSVLSKFISTLGLIVVLGSLLLNFMLIIAVGAMSHDGIGLKTTVYQDGSENQIVALYEINDAISQETVTHFSRFAREVAKNNDVKAVLLRVNSPGGGAAASDEIWKMVEDLKKTKKVVASFGALAASGGYYISAGADFIVAEPTTITGSIGVIMTLPNLEGTMDKIGVKMTTLISNNAKYWKDVGSPFKQLSPRARGLLTSLLNDMQEQFENVVKQGRGDKLKISKNTIKTLEMVKDGKEVYIEATETVPFNGQIFRSKDALAIGLIDKIGYLPDAWNEAAMLAGLSNPKVVRYHRRGGLFAEMMSSFTPLKDTAEKCAAPQILYKWEMQ